MNDWFRDESAAGGLVHNPASAYSKEMWQWNHTTRETHPLDESIRGKRPAEWQEFPKMLYRAQKDANGKHFVCVPAPDPYGYPDAARYARAVEEAEYRTRQCQRIVKSQSEQDAAARDGWHTTQQGAIDALDALEVAIANAAAEAQWGAQRMSERAQKELETAEEAAGPEHAPDVPAPRRRGRPKKVQEPLTT